MTFNFKNKKEMNKYKRKYLENLDIQISNINKTVKNIQNDALGVPREIDPDRFKTLNEILADNDLIKVEASKLLSPYFRTRAEVNQAVSLFDNYELKLLVEYFNIFIKKEAVVNSTPQELKAYFDKFIRNFDIEGEERKRRERRALLSEGKMIEEPQLPINIEDEENIDEGVLEEKDAEEGEPIVSRKERLQQRLDEASDNLKNTINNFIQQNYSQFNFDEEQLMESIDNRVMQLSKPLLNRYSVDKLSGRDRKTLDQMAMNIFNDTAIVGEDLFNEIFGSLKSKILNNYRGTNFNENLLDNSIGNTINDFDKLFIHRYINNDLTAQDKKILVKLIPNIVKQSTGQEFKEVEKEEEEKVEKKSQRGRKATKKPLIESIKTDFNLDDRQLEEYKDRFLMNKNMSTKPLMSLKVKDIVSLGNFIAEEKQAGRGLNMKRGRKPHNKKVGKGISETEEERYKELGKYVIDIKALKNNTFRVKYKDTFRPVMFYPTRRVSDDLKNFIFDIIDDGRINSRSFDRLNNVDKIFFKQLANRANLKDSIDLQVNTLEMEKENERFEVLKNSILAGQNSDIMLKEFKLLILKMMNDGRLTKNEGFELITSLTVL